MLRKRLCRPRRPPCSPLLLLSMLLRQRLLRLGLGRGWFRCRIASQAAASHARGIAAREGITGGGSPHANPQG